MEKNKLRRILTLITIFSIIAYNFLILCNINSYAVSQTISAYDGNLDNNQYPGIKSQIDALKAKYPNWNFKILYTDLDWNEVIANEYVGHGASPRNLVYKSSNYQGAWICSICGDRPYDNGSWRCASEATIKYMMDPRNSLNESDIFQFEELTYNGVDENVVNSMISGTFLQGHSNDVIQAGQNNNVNPYYIIARLIQEQGKSGTVLTSGERGYYNPFNIGASGNTTAQIIENGINYARKQGWTTLAAGINGGINFLSKEYIKKGQNTLYLQKFDVESANNGLYYHQYMQNILAAQNEGTTLRNTYIDIGAMSSTHTFIIPVYKNMPSSACVRPDGSGNTTITSDIVKVNVDQSLRLRNEPNGAITVGWLWKDEIVTRVEKATSKINGTYWDKVRKSDGTVGYAARETYETEASYKLYLVPLVEENNNNGNSSNSTVNTEKVKINEAEKIITVTPDVIAKDVLASFGGSAKIVKADGSFLENEMSIIGTGYIVEDKYTIVKSGDSNGDGKITSSDYVLIKNNIMGTSMLNGAFQKAGDYNGDGNVTSSDYVLIKNYIMNN